MSQLSPFVRAFKALSAAYSRQSAHEALVAEAPDTPDEMRWRHSAIAASCRTEALVHSAAATDLEQQIAKDCARPGKSEVTFDRKGKSGVLPLDGQ